MSDGSTAPVRRLLPASRPGAVLVHVGVVVGVVLLNLLQQPGRITFDTKLDLQLDAADLLTRSSSLWNGDWALGGLQNQASGYLFPMGPAFLLGDLLGVPMWVWERLWSAAVMLVAYEGARRLASHWPGIGAAGAVLAGLTYMLAPRVMITVGGLSGETLPAAVLPWTVLPLLLHLLGRMRRTTAFVLSAATLPWMGGQNATLVVACLVLPTLLLALASGRTLRRRLADLTGWGALVGVATLWWVVPLLLMGAYSPPFLDFIESSRDTAGSVGWLSALRGTSHWVAFFPDGGEIGWVGGYALASSAALIVPTVLVTGLGLAGFLQRDLWERRVLAVSVLVGLAVLTAGSGGWAGSVLSDVWLRALDGGLSPLRNVHKFDPVVRLPLALGVGAFLTAAVPGAWRRSTEPARSRAGWVALAASAVVVSSVAAPAAAGSLRTAGGFEGLPDGWREAAAFLRDQPEPTRTLVLPGAGFAVQTWGRTIDEPIQVLDPTPWMARAQVTVAPAGTLRLLDTVDQAVADARPQHRLAAALEALDVTHVIVRNDLDPEGTDSPDPVLVRAALGHVPGTRLVGGFGATLGGVRSVEIYELAHDADPRVGLRNWGDAVVVDGGPEVVPDLRAAGLVTQYQSTTLAQGDGPADIVTDDLRRVERTFGRVHDARSGVMTADDDYRVPRRTHDYADDAMPSARTVAAYQGASSIVASTSGGYVDVLGPVRPEQHPFSAFDGSFYTAWSTAPLTAPEGQWIEARFPGPTPVRQVALSFDVVNGARVTSVRLTTGEASVVADVGADGRALVEVGDEEAGHLRITVLEVARRGSTDQVRLSDARLAGHEITRSLVVPGRVSAGASVFLSSEAPSRACAVAVDQTYVGCSLERQVETSETTGFDRDLTVDARAELRLRGRVVATNGPLLDGLFAPLAPDLVRVTASSTFGGDPAVVSAGAVDGRPETGWTSSPGDPAPTLQLTWGPRRTVSRVVLTTSPGQPGELPRSVVVDGGPGTGEPQVVTTAGPDAGEMRPVRTNSLRISTPGPAGPDGVGIAEIRVAGIEDLVHDPDPATPTGAACGFGPVIELGGRVVDTRISGTLADVRAGRDLVLHTCGEQTVDLPAGEQRVRVVNPQGFALTNLVLVPAAEVGRLTSSSGATAPPTVRAWSATRREVSVTTAGEAVLEVSESHNPGWTARIDGQALRPVVVDGWRQGFVLPAGTRGTVELVYAPQAPFRMALIGGLALAGLLVALAALLVLRGSGRVRVVTDDHAPTSGERAREREDGSFGTASRATRLGAVVLMGVVSVPLGVGALVGWATRRRSSDHIAIGGVAGLLVAAVIALAGSEIVTPPEGADVVVGLVVGMVCGRVLLTDRSRIHHPSPAARGPR